MGRETQIRALLYLFRGRTCHRPWRWESTKVAGAPLYGRRRRPAITLGMCDATRGKTTNVSSDGRFPSSEAVSESDARDMRYEHAHSNAPIPGTDVHTGRYVERGASQSVAFLSTARGGRRSSPTRNVWRGLIAELSVTLVGHSVRWRRYLPCCDATPNARIDTGMVGRVQCVGVPCGPGGSSAVGQQPLPVPYRALCELRRKRSG